MDNIDLAKSLLNNSADTLKPNTSQSNLLPANNSTQITATAQSDSVNGYVTVQIDGENIDIPTTFNVLAGDECLVLIANRSPVCIGIIGRGDTNNANINNALSNAGEALENANNALNSVGRTNNILPYYLATGKGSNGIIVDKEEDGWFRIHGTTTASSSTSGYAHAVWTKGDYVTLHSGKSYTFSVELDGDFTFGTSTLRPQLRYYYDGTYSTAYAYPLQPATFQLAHDDTQTTAIRVALTRATGVDLADVDFRIRFKLEEGTLATPWNYTILDISEASRVATNYMEFVENTGLIIGDHTASTLGKNTLIDANGMSIRSGTTELARFNSDKIELGKNSSNAVIEFLNNKGSMSYEQQGGRFLLKSGDNTTIRAEKEYSTPSGTIYFNADVSSNCYYENGGADFSSSSLSASRNKWNYVEQKDEIAEMSVIAQHDGVYVYHNDGEHFGTGTLLKSRPFRKLWSGKVARVET